MKLRATEIRENPSSATVQVKMPKKDDVSKVIQRTRNDTQTVPPQPADRASVIIPDAYQFYEVAPHQSIMGFTSTNVKMNFHIWPTVEW